MRLLFVVVAGVALAAGAAWASAAAAGTSLTITYWEDAQRPAVKTTWTLRCDPAAGTLPSRASVCRRLLAAGGAAVLRRPPSDRACAEIWGGPQKAVVKGTIAGRRVYAVLTRTDGCEIERWNRTAATGLIPRASGAP